MKKIRLKIANWLLKKQLKTLKREKTVSNFHTAKTVGVIFSVEQVQSYPTIKAFLDFLAEKNLQTFILAYCPFKEIPDTFIGHPRINIFTLRDLNWFFIPKVQMVSKFMAKDFDLLFDLTFSEDFPVKYVNNLSKAKFKIGRASKNGKEHDMIFRIGEDQSLPYFIDQVKHYISQINKEE